MTVNNFLLVFLLFFTIMTILKYLRSSDQAIRMNSWFHILGERRKDYDFEDMLQREKRFYPVAALISLLSFLLAQAGAIFWAEIILYLLFMLLMFSIYYLRPRKK